MTTGLPTPLAPSSGAAAAMTVALLVGHALVATTATVLAYYLATYVNVVLAPPYRDRWRYFGVGVGAAAVYGVAGVVETLTGHRAATAFKLGATLFFFLFAAVGVRAMYRTVADDDPLGDLPEWSRYAVLGLFVAAWWGAYLLRPALLAPVEAVGLAAATVYSLAYAVATVRASEGTSVAAVVRQFVPALLAFAAVVVVEQAGRADLLAPALVAGVELVGTVLVGAFLFTTAVAIRQQGGEVDRMYDPTTWRGDAGGSD